MKWQLFFIVNFSFLLSDIQPYVCTLIVHLWIEALLPCTVLIKLHESWSLLRVKTDRTFAWLSCYYLSLLVVCLWFPFPPGAWDRRHHLILHGNPWTFHITIWVQNYIIFEKLTASFSWPFKIWGFASGYRQKSATKPFDGTLKLCLSYIDTWCF